MDDQPQPPDDRFPEDFEPSGNFAVVAAVFEGGLAVVAVGLGWMLGKDPMATLNPNWADVGWGLLATLPPLGMLAFCLVCPLRPFRELARVIDRYMLPLMARCSLVELAVIAILAGLGEEMLFRGIVQRGIAEWAGNSGGLDAATATGLGLGASAVLFGLAHRLTNLYALLAGAIGLYLGWLWLWSGNLLVPIVVHAAYDFLALVYLVKMRAPDNA